jgi:hypothetical protein
MKVVTGTSIISLSLFKTLKTGNKFTRGRAFVYFSKGGLYGGRSTNPRFHFVG